MSKLSKRVDTLEAVLEALISALARKGILTKNEITKEMEEKDG